MPQESSVPMSRRARFIAVLVAVAAIVVLMLGSRESTAWAETDCTSSVMCGWTGTFYSGVEWHMACPAGLMSTGTELKSAKNHCGSQFIRIGWAEGGTINWKACMSPGGERPEPGRFNRYENVGGC